MTTQPNHPGEVMTPQPVTIIRARLTIEEASTRLVVGVAMLFLRALMVWWLAPIVWDGFTLTYWETFALIVGLGFLAGNRSDYRWWTSEAAR